MQKVQTNSAGRGIIFAILGSMFWGMSGAAAQYSFNSLNLDPLWLVGIRLLFAGSLLLLWSTVKSPREIFSIWKSPKHAMLLVAFGLLGVVPSQLTYFMAIQYSNAATATVIQFTGPIFIVLFVALSTKELPRRTDGIAIILAVIGTILIVTKGQITTLALAPIGVMWGLLAGVSQASYTLIPVKLLHEFDAKLVVGWAMLVGSIAFWPKLVMTGIPKIPMSGFATIAFIVIVGTMLAYLLYLQSLNHISPTVTGMLSAFEPLTATILTILLLGTRVIPVEVVGGVLVLGTVFLQALTVLLKKRHTPLLDKGKENYDNDSN